MTKLRFTAGAAVLLLAMGVAAIVRPDPAAAQGVQEQPLMSTQEIIERLDLSGAPPEVRTRGLRPAEGTEFRPVEPAPLRPGEGTQVQAGEEPTVAAQPAARPIGRSHDFRVLFAFDSAELTPQAREALDRLGAALVSDRLHNYAFIIAGHTDAVGPEAYNLDLSRRRAESVVGYLTQRFDIDRGRLTSEGFGQSRLFDPANPTSGVNRRVEIVNAGELAAR
jgi:OmpA-OmpF porin, OOP family